MSIVVFGMNHKTAPLDIREKVFFPKDDVRPYKALFSFGAIKEGLILSTCNRVEISCVTENAKKTQVDLIDFLGREFSKYTYCYHDDLAIRHAFRVASSLDSMVVGESQILGQVKDAFRLSQSARALGPYLHRLYENAFKVAKRIRTETALGVAPVSVGTVAVQLCQKIFHHMESKKVLLLGAGEMMELMAEVLSKKGVKNFYLANRSKKENFLGAEVNFKYISLEHLPNILHEMDMVLVAINSPGYILTQSMIEDAILVRRHAPIFCIDISVPRQVDPGIQSIDNVYLYNIDDLQYIVNDNYKHRIEEAKRAESIIDEETAKFVRKYSDVVTSQV